MNYYTEIGIVGHGFVGKAVLKWFKGAAWYSKTGGSFEKVNRKRIIFLCLPTPFCAAKGGFDLSAIDENVRKLSPGKIIVLKSTVLPGTTEDLQRLYPQHRIFFNPEFLRAKSAVKDFLYPDRQIVGYADKKYKQTAGKLLDMLPSANYQGVCRAREAEMVKLMGNCYLATKVVFANQFYDYCEKVGADYKEVSRLVKFDPRIGVSHWGINTDGYRGYSGYCFPKDMKAVAIDSQSRLINHVDFINDHYLEGRRVPPVHSGKSMGVIGVILKDV